MYLRDWLNQNWPDDRLPVDVVITIGTGVTRALAEAWDCSAQVHGALSEDAIRVDKTGHITVVGFAGNGDRIAHQRDLRATGRLLYAMLMNEPSQKNGPRNADPVLAALASIRSSSFQRARDRVQVTHPVVGTVIGRLLATGNEHGFSDGWAVAEALDNLAKLPVEAALAPQIRSPRFPESETSDSTIFVALVRSGDRTAPIRMANQAPKKNVPPAPTPPKPRPRKAPPAALIQRDRGRRFVVLMSVLGMWVIGGVMGCAAVLHNRCLRPPTPADHLVTSSAWHEADTGEAPPPEEPLADLPLITPAIQVKAPTPSSNTLTIRLNQVAMAHSIELNCPSGIRVRQSTKGGTVVFRHVPAEACNLSFKGPIPARYRPVSGGQNLRCSVIGSTAVCA